MDIARSIRWAILVTALSATSALAGSRENDWAVGIGVGVGDAGGICGQLEDRSCDRADGWKLYLGHDVAEYLRLEVSWTELVTSTGDDLLLSPADEAFRVELEGPTVALMPTIQLSRSIRLFGKIGWYRWDLSAKTERVGAPDLERGDDGTDRFLGLGFRIGAPEDRHGLRLEVEQFDIAGSEPTLASASYEFVF